jgi:hypothetical protein
MVKSQLTDSESLGQANGCKRHFLSTQEPTTPEEELNEVIENKDDQCFTYHEF